MNNINLSKPDSCAIAQESIILKFSVIGCLGLALVGLAVFTFNNHQNGVKSQPQSTGKPNKGITPKQTLEPPLIITKKLQKPIEIEEGSDAWFCLQNNGGSGCLDRDRFAPNYQIVSPPKHEKTYEDYLIQYGVRESGGCDRYFNGKPNC